MTVKAILDAKGRDVVTIAPDATLKEAAALLASHGIGAVVVTREDGSLAGILSERDIVRAIGSEGAAALDRKVLAFMTARVQVCREEHTVIEVMEIITEGRFRHLPVEKDGKIAGIVSIGDVVKRRIQEAEREAEEIRTYIATA
ncbi:CBS domain-containing protein [Chelativorans sp. Marseille-P2723]|uniref:CBS domain-containing protein n=1 Tax=Chelativorans sp. Marseille-P2723 TaxID=2709133 RepID=UPI00156FE81A|nr:CBS domain-containing protein [Chelativorans sp. Marseille-P2723]